MSFSPERVDEGLQEDGVCWPQVPEQNVTRQIRRLAKVDALGGPDGSMFEKRRTRELAREQEDSVKHVTDSRGIKYP